MRVDLCIVELHTYGLMLFKMFRNIDFSTPRISAPFFANPLPWPLVPKANYALTFWILFSQVLICPDSGFSTLVLISPDSGFST